MLRSTAVFSAMTLLSRVAGYVRDALQAHLFGTSAAVSAFVIAYRIPNYLRRIFAEGSFSSAFVPVLSELQGKGDERALQDFVDHVAGALLAAVVLVTGLGVLLAPWIARLFLLFAGEHNEGLVPLTAEMLRITFPYLTFISMTALAGAVLNTFRHFGLPALTPVLHNLAVIAAMVLLARWFEVPEKALAWGVVAAGAMQLAVLWPAMARLGVRPRLRFGMRHPGVRRVARLMLPTIFSSSVAQVNLLVGTVFASLLVAEAQSWLYYSDRLTELPLGLFGVAVGTVILPQLSRHHADADTGGYSKALDWGLRIVLLVGLPAALGLALLAEPLTATLFLHGEFSPRDTAMVGYALVAMSAGIPTFMLSKVLLPAFYARQDTRTPMRAAVRTVIANVALTVAIVTPLWWWRVPYAHAGIAAATAIAGVLNAWLLWRALRREGVYVAQPGWGRWMLRILAALAVMTLAVLAVRHQVGAWAALDWKARVAWLLAAVGAGAGAYGATLVALGLRPRHLRH
ncbi:murein biosynthesis integral membrane protein MurJ [Vulcaniibacterium thermophilum]|uniref:Probable lipid II flippase MurJ n=1 Tax=Vulcaniibacterium thermophilum TaxID=1169913 RepID=A0A918YYN0_9GAMM|nr:murein biosynthesis integral membrane protein MurJ [Vulcaniibacterium thermophilum]GHE29185.1 putative lipid II flippase MurJ [Vulcaniibacterium thermophilum]